MRYLILTLLVLATQVSTAQTVTQLKKQLETVGTNPFDVLKKYKKKYRIDTVAVVNTTTFLSLQDSLAYKGKEGKCYGPYENGKYLVQVLGKANNTFNRLARCTFDTSFYSYAMADSLSTVLLKRINAKERKFEDVAKLYNRNNGFGTSGDMGYCASGSLIPLLEKEIKKRKKGEVFKMWSDQGADLIKIVDKGKVDVGYALLLIITLK
jgi:hypothetical protein